MEPLHSLRAEPADSTEQGVDAAVALLRHELADLIDRAEALDLGSVAAHLRAAAELCTTEVRDFRTN